MTVIATVSGDNNIYYLCSLDMHMMVANPEKVCEVLVSSGFTLHHLLDDFLVNTR